MSKPNGTRETTTSKTRHWIIQELPGGLALVMPMKDFGTPVDDAVLTLLPLFPSAMNVPFSNSSALGVLQGLRWHLWHAALVGTKFGQVFRIHMQIVQTIHLLRFGVLDDGIPPFFFVLLP